MSSFGSWLEPVLVGPLGSALVITLQVALIAAIARAVTARMRDAAQQHRIWVAAILLSAALLPAHIIGGGWQVQLPAFTQHAPTHKTSADEPISVSRVKDGLPLEDTAFTVPMNADPVVNSASSSMQNSVEPLSSPASTPLTTTRQANSTTNPWSVVNAVVVFLYFYVAILLLVRFAIMVRRLEGLLKLFPLASNATLDLARQVASSLGLKRLPSIRVVTSGEAMVAGVNHTLLLPDDFEQWPSEGRHATIAHELAHVVRRDLWIEALVKCACFLLWFHPAVWYMRRMVQRTSEQATDVAALGAGQTATDYVSAIVDVLKTQHLGGQPKLALSATASTSMGPVLQERVRYLLSTDIVPIDTRWSRIFAACSLSLLISIALVTSVRLVSTSLIDSPAPDPRSEPDPAPTSTLALIETAQTEAQEPRPEDNDLWVRMRDCAVAVEPVKKSENKANISGRAVDANGQAVADAIVVITESIQYGNDPFDLEKFSGVLDRQWKRTQDIIARTRTGANGEFELRDIALSQRAARLLWQGDIVVMHPQAGFAWMSLSFPPEFKLVRENLTIELEPTADISGTVVDAQQRPIAGAEIRAARIRLGSKPRPSPSALSLEFPHSQLTPSTRTDASGKFTLKNLPKDLVVQLIAEHPDFLRNIVHFTSSAASTKDLPPVYGEASNDPFGAPSRELPVQKSPGQIQLDAGVVLSGQVVDEGSGQALPGSKLYLDDFYVPYQTDAAGNFRFRTSTRIQQRSLRVTAPEGSVNLSRKLDLQAALTDPSKPLNVALSKGVWIQGKVTADDGQAIADVTVRVWDHREQQDAMMGVANSEGQFKFVASRGKHKLVVGSNKPGFHMPERELVLSGSSEVADITDWPVELADTSSGKDVTLPDIVIKRTEPVECVVLFADGRPAVGAYVAIKENSKSGRSSYRSETKTTGEAGRVKLLTRPYIAGAVVAAARLTTDDTEYRNAGTPLTQRDAQGRVKIILKQPSRASGRVLSNGKPVAGAIIIVHSQAANGESSQTALSSNEQGEFNIPTTEGRHAVRIAQMPLLNQELRGIKEAKQNRAGDYEFGDLEVNLPLKKLTGQLVDQQGQPVSGALVRPLPLNPNAPFSASNVNEVTTDNDGNFRFDGMPSGDYDLNVKLVTDRSFKPTKQKITAGNPTTVKLESK